MSAPLSAVLDAFHAGARSLSEISQRTGLDAEVVQAAVEHLTRTGRLVAKQLAAGCPSGGCTSCASGQPDGKPGCGASGPSPRRSGPVLVQLTLPPRPAC